jgi:hypothetical protein
MQPAYLQMQSSLLQSYGWKHVLGLGSELRVHWEQLLASVLLNESFMKLPCETGDDVLLFDRKLISFKLTSKRFITDYRKNPKIFKENVRR